jgi:serine/threonine-protein kinase
MIGRIIQNYKIVSLLGEGGMGTVYKAIDFKLDRYAAIKVLNPKEVRNPNFIERFKREAKNQAKLSHPNIVSVYGFVESKDVLGFVMEYIEGRTVEEFLKEYGRLSLSDSIQILKQVLIGAAYAHTEGFIHRDLKPSNIIIDTKGIVKITDFGIAKSVNESMSITKAGAQVGTILYMSPEQIKGYDSTVKSDLYSLGITLYEMISGKVPFDFPNEYEILDAHINNIPFPLSQIYQEIPAEIDVIILRAMNKSASGNYNDCTEFIYELENLENNLPAVNQSIEHSQSHIEINSPVKKTSSTKRIFNFLLFLVFVSLLVFSFKAVTDYLLENEKKKAEQLEETNLSAGPFETINTSWQKINLETTENINSISYLNENQILLFGSNGLILKSSDNGISWSSVRSGIRTNLYSSVTLNNNRIILSVGEKGVILRSSDGGRTWLIKNSRTKESLFSIRQFAGKIYAVGSNGTIIYSVDLGITWTEKSIKDNRTIYDIYFLNREDGFIVGWNGLLMQTSNGGNTWFAKTKITDNYLRSVDFSDKFNGLAVGGAGTILLTDDGGLNWVIINPETMSSLNKIVFRDSIGYALSNKGEIFITQNNGASWEKHYTGIYSILTDLSKTFDGKLLISGSNGTLISNKHD